MIASLAFYLFGAILIAAATMVVTARNPVHAVLFLILSFFNAAALFVIAGAEFLAMVLVIVYVGAVAVLFLFVVMMLDVNFAQLREGFQRYAPIGAVIGGILALELIMVFAGWKFAAEASVVRMAPIPGEVTNTMALGLVLYTDFVLPFEIAGLVLLVSMIGAIVLTLRDRPRSRRQVIAEQIARTTANTTVLVDAPLGKGIGELGILRPLPAEEPAARKEPEHAMAGHGGNGGTH